MSAAETIESGIVSELQSLTESGSDLFATVTGVSWTEKKMLRDHLARERMPAVYVMTAGYSANDKEFRRVSSTIWQLWIADRGQRDDHAARIGDTDTTGTYALAEKTRQALQDMEIDSKWLVLPIDEQPVSFQDGLGIYQQRYEVRGLQHSAQPLFKSTDIIGSYSSVEVEVGTPVRQASTFAFPGIDGVFERHLGIRQRPIVWRGQLRAPSISTMKGLEKSIDERIQNNETGAIADEWGETYDDCVIQTFRRKSPRQKDPLTDMFMLDFELEFAQLNPQQGGA